MTDIANEVKAALDELVDRLEKRARKEVEAAVTDWVDDWKRHHRPVATGAILVINPIGDQMPGTINVDVANETVNLVWTDDHGDTNAQAPVSPSGNPIVVTFTSDNTAVVTVANDATNPQQGDVTTVAEGTANIGATIANDDGSPVLETVGPNTGQPFPAIAPVPVTVTAGSAVSGGLALSV